MPFSFIKQKIVSNWILIVCLLVGGVLFYLWYAQPTLYEKAYSACQDSVKQQLDPALKPVFPDFNKVVTQRLDPQLTLKSYYDAPDSSGALKRGYYSCVFEMTSEYDTRLVSTKLY